ncbi:TIR domain-containing protein [Kibdelosporangium persicum]|uniref:High-affnity carbon uptake protein Hat/HatR n=1 Tax=Kibdelosporangium persicum TaxID=2698649 RepID=A0ABX2FD10_9PSEU|nr:TIR domain-containing protein [Kibdelosporangium persicum]NRN68795.1 High-affnity carbon uptake protein Hat/HatR [Kibdelosporangium persicum]
MRQQPDKATLATWVGTRRERLGWSLTRLARECEVAGGHSLTEDALTEIENQLRPVGVHELKVLAHVFGVPADEAATLTASVTTKAADQASDVDPGAAVVLPARAPRPPDSGTVDFFISYSLANEDWATWIAHELEDAGYHVMIQSWDFVPGTNFFEFIDRGIREASAVIAVLSQNYLGSKYGKMEWIAALQAAHNDSTTKLLPVRIEEVVLDGLLAPITFVDLVGLTDPAVARARLLDRIRHALSGRAKPDDTPRYPRLPQTEPPAVNRVPTQATRFPPSIAHTSGERQQVSILHVAAPRFGAGPDGPVERLAQLRSALDEAADPDLIVVGGSLTESGSPAQFEQAMSFITGLRSMLGLEANRVVVVPGIGDITVAACEAYFADCRADGIEPQAPYFRKWRHFSRLFGQLYPDVDSPVFVDGLPWTLYAVADLRIAVAGLNSTISHTHLSLDEPGWLGPAQLDWFAQSMAGFAQSGHLRIGVLQHAPTSTQDPAADKLRDTAELDRVLAPHLNLLLHTEGASGPAGELPSGVPVVRPPRNGAQILTITRDGLTSWSLGAGSPAEAVRVNRRWHAVDRTFPAADSGPLDQEPQPTVEPGEDPVSLLLQRITEVCEVRYPGARIRRLAGRPASLLVTYPDGEAVHQFRVAAHVGALSGDDVDAFVRVLRGSGTEQGAELVYQGPNPGTALLEDAVRDGVRVRSFAEFQGLLDLRDYVTAQTERLRKDLVYPPDLYVPQRFREVAGVDSSVRQDVVAEMIELLSADEGSFILLMGDFGRGKTFAMRKLAMELPVRLPGVTPILIELRTLDKAHRVETLVAAHLANHGEARIDLRAFTYLLRQGRVVLLFDGFDELASRVTYERAADHLQTLLAAAQGQAKIVVSSRTQHFQNDEQVRTALGERVGVLAHRRILQLEDFTPEQMGRYLVNRYGHDQRAAHERLDLVSRIEDLGGLARNPRMLSFVADLDADRLAAAARARQAMSAAGLYQEVLSSWLAFEYRRVHGMRGSPTGLSIDELWHAVTTLAVRMWESNEVLLRLDDVAEIAQALTGLADTPLSPPQATHAVGAGSLLVRTEEMFGFIHGSVMEWLVANEIAAQFNRGDENPPLLGRQVLSQLTVDFLCDLADPHRLRAWAMHPDSEHIANTNALKVSKRLRTPAKADLRGASLRGEDFSYRDLSGVDLTGADLTDARLIGTKLSRAIMRDAQLRRVRLDDAVLSGADLTGADLTEARLSGTDLRGVEATGCRWSRAALLNVTADNALRTSAQLGGAAVAPGQPVLVGLQPSGVGVPFGFEVGRLPRPLAYSTDGSLLAVGNGDGGVLLCDTDKGLPIRTLKGHLDRVYAVTYGASALVTGSADGTVRCWDPSTGEQHAVFTDHEAPVWPLTQDRRGKLVAYGDAAGVVWVRAMPDGQVLQQLPGHIERIWALAFHPAPDTALLATADNAGTVRIWDLVTGTEAHRMNVPGAAAIYSLSFSHDGRLLAAGGRNGRLSIWDTDTGARTHHLTGHPGDIYSVEFHPKRALLATGDTVGAVRLWQLSGAQARMSPLRSEAASVYQLAFSPDGTALASGDADGGLRVWDIPSGQERFDVQAHRGAVWPPAFRPDSRQIATTGKDGTVRIWEPEDGRQIHELYGHGRRITKVNFNPAGDLLAVSGNDGRVRVWDPHLGKLVTDPLQGRADQLTSAVFSPTKPLLATTSNDGGMHMWHLGSWESDQELDVETDHVWASAFDPTGNVLATANDDDSVRLWWRPTGRRKLILHDHRGRVRSVAFSPDGRTVATGCDDSKVRLFDADTGENLKVLLGHSDRVYEVQFTADGTVLASVSNDGTAILWDVATGAALHTLAGQRGKLWTGRISPDGQVFATAGDDTLIHLWDLGTGAHLHALAGHTRRIWSIDFSPDGRMLASGADDGTTRLWDVGDRSRPRLSLTLLGLRGAWAAVAPDGRYKTEGKLTSEFWHVIGLCRFEIGELDTVLRNVHTVPADEPF